jgi:hypothetical protein
MVSEGGEVNIRNDKGVKQSHSAHMSERNGEVHVRMVKQETGRTSERRERSEQR